MVDKKSTKKRTEVKDLPKKEKKLSKGDLKKVKGGEGFYDWHEDFVVSKTPKPGTIK